MSEMTGIVNPWPCSTRYRSTAIAGAAISCRLFGRLGCHLRQGRQGRATSRYTRAGADMESGRHDRAALRSGSREKGVAGALGLTLPVGVSSSRLKLSAGGRYAPLRGAPGATATGALAGLYPSWWRTRLATRACSSWGCGNYSCKLASEQQPKVTMACQIWQHGRQRGVHTKQPPVHRRGRWAKTGAV